jgi:hypothetical protein
MTAITRTGRVRLDRLAGEDEAELDRLGHLSRLMREVPCPMPPPVPPPLHSMGRGHATERTAS